MRPTHTPVLIIVSRLIRRELRSDCKMATPGKAAKGEQWAMHYFSPFALFPDLAGSHLRDLLGSASF
jgi:hypothetical protein